MASARPRLASPARPSASKIATGMVANSRRRSSSVAPNSPSETAKAKTAPTSIARAEIGNST